VLWLIWGSSVTISSLCSRIDTELPAPPRLSLNAMPLSPAKAAPPHEAQADSIIIDLRNPWIAGFLAWLWPGAGHIYQRRYGKGLLFMACVLSLFLFGVILGEGRVVYAKHPLDQLRAPEGGGRFAQLTHRIAVIAPLPYWLQVVVGAPALPAVVQRIRANQNQPPLWNGFMAPPNSTRELDRWHRELNQRFEMGLMYTMIAGILNFFAIWDACAGPAPAEPTDKKKKDDTQTSGDKS
jgi:hypothetical protein